jgi:hypothetical protein
LAELVPERCPWDECGLGRWHESSGSRPQPKSRSGRDSRGAIRSPPGRGCETLL